MALFQILEPDNGIKVGDLITSYHSGYWIVTSIEKRFVNDESISRGLRGKDGDPINSMIHYELAFDGKFKPSGKKKKVKKCDAWFCAKVDKEYVLDLIKQKKEEIEAICSFAKQAKINLPEEKPFKPLDIGGEFTGCDYCGSIDCDGKCG